MLSVSRHVIAKTDGYKKIGIDCSGIVKKCITKDLEPKPVFLKILINSAEVEISVIREKGGLMGKAAI